MKAEIKQLWGFDSINTLLDVGCGTGLTSDFSEYGLDVTGAD
ncbi:class I SAM-dependent methyltransferase, partial [Candidatus Woesearchaeota archaeon]|nr:class I SAM-dependent methyltransferase [Candidatus Woesearchaeota archaeon]